jgi:23S rRNA pseudouridine2605 synthase
MAPFSQTSLINFIRENSSFSRREIMECLNQGFVYVNDRVSTNANHRVSKNDLIVVKGVRIYQRQRRYYMFNKPTNVISTYKDPKGRKDLSHFIKKYRLPTTLRPCGRLDRHSSGLLLFSNDGAFINQMLHPSFSIKKTYEITISHPLSEGHKKQLEQGFFLEDGPVSIQFDTVFSHAHFLVTITIGRNRILRRSFEFFGYDIQVLHRQAIGPLRLNDLPFGEFKELSISKIKTLVLN